MKLFFLSLSISLISFTLTAQNNVADYDLQDQLIFENEPEFNHDNSFDGILNYDLHKRITSDPKLNFSQNWNTQTLYSSKNRGSVTQLNDTLWMCVEDSANGQFVMPHSGYMTSKFGPRWGRSHQGVDIGLKTGEMVRSAWNGRVRYAKFNEGGYGNLVVVRHYNGFETYYAHLSKLLVSPNQEVKAGDVIGLGGNTGHSFGAHLHFEVRFFDVAINPEHIIDFASNNVRDENVMVHKNIFQVKLPGGYKKSSVKEEEHDHDHELNHEEDEFEPVELMAGVTLPVASEVKVIETPKKVTPTKTVVKEYKRYYSVRSGDNLSKIADRNRTTVEKLCQLNGLKASRVLEVGTSIRVK